MRHYSKHYLELRLQVHLALRLSGYCTKSVVASQLPPVTYYGTTEFPKPHELTMPSYDTLLCGYKYPILMHMLYWAVLQRHSNYLYSEQLLWHILEEDQLWKLLP